MSASSEQTETAANPPAAANRHAGPVLPNTLPNALDFLTAMEQQLAEFRQLAAQQQLAEAALAEMRGELEQRAASLDAKARQTDESTLVLAALDEELNTRRQDLDRQAGDLQAKQASDAQALAKLEQEFKARYARLEAENSAAKADLAAAQEAVESGEQNRCAAQQRAAELESQRMSLEAETMRLVAERAELQASDAEALANLEQEFEARYARLEAENSAAKADLAAAQAAVQSGEENRCAAEQRAAELESQRMSLEAETMRLVAERAELQASDAEALANLEQEFEARYARLEAENSAAKVDLAAAHEAFKSGEQNRCAAEQRAAEFECQRMSLEAETVRLVAERAELQASDAEALANLEQEFEARHTKLEAENVAAKAELAAALQAARTSEQDRSAAEQRAAEFESQQIALEAETARLAAERGALQTSLDADRQAHAGRTAELQAAHDAMATRALDTEHSAAHLRSELAQALSELNGHAQVTSELHGKLDAAMAEAQSSCRAAQDAAESLARQSDEHQREQVERTAVHTAELEAARAVISASAAPAPPGEPSAEATARITELERELTGSQAALDRREDALRVLATRLLNSEERINQAQQQVNSAAERIAELESRVGTSGSAAPDEDGFAAAEGRSASDLSLADDLDFLKHRRERLTRIRKAVDAKARKLLSAKSALQRKNQECEDVLAGRAKLAAQAQELEIERRAIRAFAAKNKVAGILCYALICAAIIGMGAWHIGGIAAPSTFAARTTIKADTPGREPTKDDLLGWTVAHENVLTDPEFLELAAARFAQRNMATLATAGAVKSLVEQNTTLMTDAPGKLTIELRSQGKERTERELETLTLAATHLSNSRRDARGDGAATIITDLPKAGGEPISDQRLMYVITVGGGGLMLCAFIGYGLYRLLVRGKQSFERDVVAG